MGFYEWGWRFVCQNTEKSVVNYQRGQPPVKHIGLNSFGETERSILALYGRRLNIDASDKSGLG